VSGRTVDLRPAGTPGATYRLVGIENIVGTGFSDTLTGSAADNWFVSNGFDDRLVGLGGDDAFTVGRGLGYSAEPRTVVDGGTGIDLLDFDDLGRATGYVVVDLGKTGFQDTRGGGTMQITSVENISGTAFDDYLTGGRGANALYGGGGGDTLRGGDGNDLLLGDQSMAGTKDGVHYIAPRLATARTGGDDALYGGAGNDRLFGHAGDDLLIGDRGADELTGGLGKDIFYYHGIGDSRGKGIDTILDFGRGDRIHVAHIDADTSERGNQAFHFGATADHTGDIIVHFDAAAGMTIADFHVDGDGIADMTIHLAGEIVLTARDFVL
jgi:Ca2+-binding RTX toxin-like protein